MARRGRPPEGAKLVRKLDGSEMAKQRVEIVLQTISGEKTIEAACGELGVSEAGFHKMRMQVLEGAVRQMEPKPKGRPKRLVEDDDDELIKLKAENDELKFSLMASHLREELAITMPHVLLPRKKKRLKGKRKGTDKT